MEKYRVVLFISRNKDNQGLEGFKERRKNFLWKKDEYPINEFQDFVSKGITGELSRMYVSVNTRDIEKTKKMLLVKLITDPVDLTNIESVVASIAAKPENRAESKWLFDFDSSIPEEQHAFLNELTENVQKEIEAGHVPEDTSIREHKTLHGMAYVVSHRFDCEELLNKWKDVVSLKRDDMLYVTSDKKKEFLYSKRIPIYSCKDLTALVGKEKK